MPIVSRGLTMTQQATERLRRAIVSGELQPGTLYSATTLGEWLGVSRTPIREATAELARLGLVAIEPNRGIRVLETSIESLLAVFELRLIIEVPMARKAALNDDVRARKNLQTRYEMFEAAAKTGDAEATLRADRDFHTAVLELAGNDRAAAVLHEQRNIVLQSGVETVPKSRSSAECFADHQDIHSGIMDSDPEAAAGAMHRHILNTAQMLISQETTARPEFAKIDVAAQLSWIRP